MLKIVLIFVVFISSCATKNCNISKGKWNYCEESSDCIIEEALCGELVAVGATCQKKFKRFRDGAAPSIMCNKARIAVIDRSTISALCVKNRCVIKKVPIKNLIQLN